ncbi:MAG TPA: ABC transporter ATP-binding protein [Aeromicrobium sp.]|nr:ABC transporter ATP-binding protein [Aeromicrobium sp.]
MIEFVDVDVRVPGPVGELTLLTGVSAKLTEQRIAVIGGNGGGKSTLARLTNGLIGASSGSVIVEGLNVAEEAPKVRRKVGFVFTNPLSQLVMPTAAEDIALSLRRTIKDKKARSARTSEILEEFGLGHRADTSVHALSGGQQQLLALAGVLACDPAIVVADEPTTLLDLRNSRAVAERLFSLEQQLVLVTHDLDLAGRCDRALVIESGRVIFDGAATEAVDFYRASVSP